MFQQYPQNDANAPVLLHEGRFRVRVGDRCIEPSGSAYLRWLPSPRINFEIETLEPNAGLRSGSLAVELAGFRTKHVLAHPPSWGSTPSGSTSIRASAGEMEWGGERSLLSAGFQIVNSPDVITPGSAAVPGDPVADAGDFGTIQTVALKHDGWQIRIVAGLEARDRYKRLKDTGGYAFTHVGQLTRVDGSAFSAEQGKDILESLRQFLSFARGAACALPVHWGRGEDDEIVWRRFQSPIVDPWGRSHLTWTGEGLHTGGILAELFDAFCRIHKDPKFREPLVVALHWYRHCNTNSSGLEGSLVLGMAALELLGTLIVVDDRNGSMSAGRYDRLCGAEKLRKLLEALKLQPDIPKRYSGLTKLAERNSSWDSCDALVKLRNGFVHAKEKNRRMVFASDGKAATPDAWQLSLWYQELALLHMLKYRGNYFNRTMASCVGQVEPVPWSKS